jgi:uncharacterized protein involved in exopolysaccharide biosynthesis
MWMIGVLLKRHLTLGLAIFVLVYVLVSLIHTQTPKVYESKASFYIQRQVPTEYAADYNSDMADHLRIMKSDLVLTPVLAKLKQIFKAPTSR